MERESIEEGRLKNVPHLTVEYDPNRIPDLYAPQMEVIPHDIPPVRVGMEGAIGSASTPFRLIRRSLRVVVRNTGPAVAEHCTAELRIVESSSPAARRPSAEPKALLWESSESTEQDIAALMGHATLNVLFADTRLTNERQTNEPNPIYALVATRDSIGMRPSNIIRAQDGFGRGEFVAELTIIARNGTHLISIFRIRVTDDWEQLSMERIS